MEELDRWDRRVGLRPPTTASTTAANESAPPDSSATQSGRSMLGLGLSVSGSCSRSRLSGQKKKFQLSPDAKLSVRTMASVISGADQKIKPSAAAMATSSLVTASSSRPPGRGMAIRVSSERAKDGTFKLKIVEANLDQNENLLLGEPLRPRRLPRCPGIGAAPADLAALHGQVDIIAAGITGDNLEFGADQLVERVRIEVGPAGEPGRARTPWRSFG